MIFAFLSFSFLVCNAQVELEVNKSGVYRAKQEAQDFVASNIVAEPEALKYIERFSEAISSPYSLILVEKSEKIIKMTGFFEVLKEVNEKAILFNSNENKVVFVEINEERKEKSFLLIFGLISITLMILSNILIRRKRNRVLLTASFAVSTTLILSFFITAVLVIVFASIAAFKSTLTFAPVFAFASVFISVAAFVSIVIAFLSVIAFTESYRSYKGFVAIYYMLIAVYFIFMFLGI